MNTTLQYNGCCLQFQNSNLKFVFYWCVHIIFAHSQLKHHLFVFRRVLHLKINFCSRSLSLFLSHSLFIYLPIYLSMYISVTLHLIYLPSIYSSASFLIFYSSPLHLFLSFTPLLCTFSYLLLLSSAPLLSFYSTPLHPYLFSPVLPKVFWHSCRIFRVWGPWIRPDWPSLATGHAWERLCRNWLCKGWLFDLGM